MPAKKALKLMGAVTSSCYAVTVCEESAVLNVHQDISVATVDAGEVPQCGVSGSVKAGGEVATSRLGEHSRHGAKSHKADVHTVNAPPDKCPPKEVSCIAGVCLPLKCFFCRSSVYRAWCKLLCPLHNLEHGASRLENAPEGIATCSPATAARLSDALSSLIKAAEMHDARKVYNILTDELARIDRLVSELRMYEASCVLQEIDSAVELVSVMGGSSADEELERMLLHLQADGALQSLRDFGSRYRKALAEIAAPAHRTDTAWGEFQMKDPLISDDFTINFKLRYKTVEEYDPQGPLAQFVFRAEMAHTPLRLSRRVAIEREVDLFRLTADSSMTYDLSEGKARTRENLFSAGLQNIGRGGIIPFKTDNFELREFTALRDPPLPGLRAPSFCMMSSNPPEDTSWLGGCKVPPCRDGCKRVSGMTILRFLEPESTPDRFRMTILAQGGINVPTFLLPIGLVKRIAAHHILATMRHMAVNVAAHWDEMPYQERMDQFPEFYRSVASLDSAGVPASWS